MIGRARALWGLTDSPSRQVALDGTSGSAAASSDVLVSFAVGAEAVDFSIVVQSNASASAGVKLDVRVADANTTSSGLRSANATTSVLDTDKSGASLDFAILPEETSVSVRVLVDRAVVEAFVAGGRAVFTQKVVWQDSLVYVASTSGAVANLTVYSMGCGWNDPPYQERP